MAETYCGNKMNRLVHPHPVVGSQAPTRHFGEIKNLKFHSTKLHRACRNAEIARALGAALVLAQGDAQHCGNMSVQVGVP